jgi:hypothetical protein
MNYFSHEKLDVYQASLEWIILVEEIVKQLSRGRTYLVDQLQRAGTSVLLNIAEGAGEYAIHEKIRFYRMVRRSGLTHRGFSLKILYTFSSNNFDKIRIA